MKTILIQGGRIIDPAQGMDAISDILLKDGKVAAIGQALGKADFHIDAHGKLVTPGLIDMHVHFREPGDEKKETIATGSEAAAAGGFTSVCTMPNTNPPIDSAEGIRFTVEQAETVTGANILPVGAITRGRRGTKLADLKGMARAGAVAFSDDGSSVENPDVLRQAMEKARLLARPIISHCEDERLSADGVMHEGQISAALNLPGIPAEAEERIVERDISLAQKTGCRLHIAHVSTAGSVEMIRQAKSKGITVSAEATPHHISLTDESVRGKKPFCKMKPPLRTAADVAAIKKGLKDGTIDCLASDHAPHGTYREDLSFIDAPFGVIGLESALAIYIAELIETEILDWPTLAAKMSSNPARVLGLAGKGTLAAGADADVTIIDPDAAWTIDARKFKSKSRNCPWHGQRVKGRAVLTIVGGEIAFRLK